jgi:hypothetical protein
MRLTESQLKKLIKGTVLATILLAAQEGGRPLHEATWILVGAFLVSVVDSYSGHVSSRHESGVSDYFSSLFDGVVKDLPRIVAVMPTVLILVLAWTFHWSHDHRNPDGSGTPGYETVAMNINVVLLFIFGFLAARRSGSSWWGTILFALMNAFLGWLIIFIELALE